MRSDHMRFSRICRMPEIRGKEKPSREQEGFSLSRFERVADQSVKRRPTWNSEALVLPRR